MHLFFPCTVPHESFRVDAAVKIRSTVPTRPWGLGPDGRFPSLSTRKRTGGHVEFKKPCKNTVNVTVNVKNMVGIHSER